MAKQIGGLLVALALSIAPMAVAQTGEPGANEKGKGWSAADSAVLAVQLKRYGEEANSPLALVLAAQLAGTLDGDAIAVTKASEGGTTEPDSPAASKSESRSSLDGTALLARAAELSQGDAAVAALVAREQSGERSRSIRGQRYAATIAIASGGRTHRDRVLGGRTDTYKLRFGRGASSAMISGDGDTDLDCYVYDREGNLVARDTDYTDDCVLTWHAAYTGDFTIKIENRGIVYNEYFMALSH